MKAILNKNLFFIEQKQGWVVVSDETINKDDYFIQINKPQFGILKATVNFGYDPEDIAKKVIATINFKFDDNIPYVDINTTSEFKDDVDHFIECYTKRKNKSNDFLDFRSYELGFIDALQTKIKYKYTQEDFKKVIKVAFAKGNNQTATLDNDIDKIIYNVTKELNQIQEIEFDVDIIDEYLVGKCGDNEIWDYKYKLKTIFDPNHKAGKLIIKNIKYNNIVNDDCKNCLASSSYYNKNNCKIYTCTKYNVNLISPNVFDKYCKLPKGEFYTKIKYETNKKHGNK